LGNLIQSEVPRGGIGRGRKGHWEKRHAATHQGGEAGKNRLRLSWSPGRGSGCNRGMRYSNRVKNLKQQKEKKGFESVAGPKRKNLNPRRNTKANHAPEAKRKGGLKFCRERTNRGGSEGSRCQWKKAIKLSAKRPRSDAKKRVEKTRPPQEKGAKSRLGNAPVSVKTNTERESQKKHWGQEEPRTNSEA